MAAQGGSGSCWSADIPPECRQCAGERTLTRQLLNVGLVPIGDIRHATQTPPQFTGFHACLAFGRLDARDQRRGEGQIASVLNEGWLRQWEPVTLALPLCNTARHLRGVAP